jgi:hypothetical protein
MIISESNVCALSLFSCHRITWTNSEFESLLQRFERIFPRKLGQQFVYVAGNHDLGWNVDYSNGRGEEILQAYVSYAFLHYLLAIN